MRKTVGGGQILEMHSIGEKGEYGKDQDGSRTIYCQHVNVRMRYFLDLSGPCAQILIVAATRGFERSDLYIGTRRSLPFVQ